MKKLLTLLVTVALIVPQIALASWWNPISWFKKPTPVATQEISHNQSISGLAQTVSTSTPKKKETKTQDSKNKVSANSNNSNKVTKKPATPQLVKLNNSQIIQKVKPAVVYISTDTKAGTGMIFTTDGYILTNAHVVSGSSVASISTLNNGSYSGRVIGVNTKLDLAVIKIDASTVLPTVVFDDSDKVMQGDAIFTLGFPFGIAGDVAFKEGTISRRLDDNLEISAEIHPGNSGGPLVDQYGKVVGINSSAFGNKVGGLQVGEVIKFAIPINVAKANIDSLKSGSSDIDPKKEAKQKIMALFMRITVFLSQQTDSSCPDAVFQSEAGNYYSAKDKIDYCIKSLTLKKSNFIKLINEDMVLLNSLNQSILSAEDFKYVADKGDASISKEILAWTYVQLGIDNWIKSTGTESWRHGALARAYYLQVEIDKESQALEGEVDIKINQLVDSMK